MKNDDEGFFPIDTEREKHWREMPEFKQKRIKIHKIITVRFKNEAAVQEFAKPTGLAVSDGFQNVWFPQVKHTDEIKKVYVDAPTERKGRRTK